MSSMNSNSMPEKDKFDEFAQIISDFTDTTPDSDVVESLDFMKAKLEQRPDDWRAHLAIAQIITRNFTRHGITRDLFDEAGFHINATLEAMPGTLYKLRDFLNKSAVSDQQATETLRNAAENVKEMMNKYGNLWKEFSDSEEEFYRKPLREGVANHERDLAEDREKLAATDSQLGQLRNEFEKVQTELDKLKGTAKKLEIFKWLWILFAIGAIAAFSFKHPIIGAASIVVGILSLVPFAVANSKATKFENTIFAEAERKFNDLESERSHISSDIEFHENWINGKKEYL